MRIIDKTPPAPTGDAQRDIQALNDYLTYLREQINFNINLANKEARDNGT